MVDRAGGNTRLKLVYADAAGETANFVEEDGQAVTLGGFTPVTAKVSNTIIAGLVANGWAEVPTHGIPDVKIYSRSVTATVPGANTVTQYFGYADNSQQLLKVSHGGTYGVKYAYHLTTPSTVAATHAKTGEIHDGTGMGEMHEYITLNQPADFTTHWTLDAASGYYYYNTVLAAGEETEALLESVSFADALPDTFMGAVYQLTPVMEAVQADEAAVDAVWTNPTVPAGIKRGWFPTGP